MAGTSFARVWVAGVFAAFAGAAACVGLVACDDSSPSAAGCATSADCLTGVCVDGRCVAIADSGLDAGPPDASDAGRGGPDARPTCLDDPSLCDDGVDCTVDICQPDRSCSHTADHAICDAGRLCNATDGCVAPPPCTGDSICDDDEPCNGIERCVESRCQSGVVTSCDDSNPCTLDGCDAAHAGANATTGCFHAPPDADGDGHLTQSCGGDDCDDTLGSVYADAPELCADGLDNDCDGSGDCADESCVGTCPDCPETEVCDGRDNDCDESADQGFGCVRGLEGSCATGCGTTGTRSCDGACTWSVCEPPAELCDGIDQDCDGEIDETLACVPGEAGDCTTVCGSQGTHMCADSCAWSDCEPPYETCNGRDDDCDGSVDDGFLCPQGLEVNCATSCGSAGHKTCTDSCTWEACVPPTEVCNGVDDNCNGLCDDGAGSACCLGARNLPCTTRCGTAGLGECVGGCQIDCRAIEICNSCDDDGDMSIDEDGVCDGENCANPILVTASGTVITRSTCGRLNDDAASFNHCGNGQGGLSPDMVVLVVPPTAATPVSFTLVSASFTVQWGVTRAGCDSSQWGPSCNLENVSLSGYTHYFVHVSSHTSGSCGTFTLAVTW